MTCKFSKHGLRADEEDQDSGGDVLNLASMVSAGSGPVNEDGCGHISHDGEVCAAWVFDGVTGINGRNYLPGSDAQWLVARADDYVRQLASSSAALPEILSALVAKLMAGWSAVSTGLDLPASYDPPAACLILAKRYGAEWKALRLGDSCLLARYDGGDHRIFAASPNNAFDHWLSREAKKRRDAGVLDIKALLAEFRPQLIAGRQKRNRPDGYSILEASEAALNMAEYINLGDPACLLLCTDGYYRAVDHYGLHDNASLIEASLAEDGAARVLHDIRAVEAGDPSCEAYLRFKPADDATAVMLRRDR